ncbi:MAG TPA: response regulator transcription factor [Solirubrobacteraceae bacterium]|nr:response regulator transcription factor [Solirubrobacteraceae bacterium]
MKRLLIVADHSLVAHSIRLALKQTVGFQVIGVIDGRLNARDALLEMRPDVVLVDDMHDPRAAEDRNHDHALARLRDASEHVPTAQRLLLTLRMDEGWMNDVFEAGAHAVLSKSMHPVSLGTMLREVVRGNVVHRFERRPAAVMADCPLTLREKEILALVAEGATNGQIARMLWVTEQTVKFHLSNTYRKLGVANRTEASHYAHLNNLVTTAEAVAC